MAKSKWARRVTRRKLAKTGTDDLAQEAASPVPAQDDVTGDEPAAPLASPVYWLKNRLTPEEEDAAARAEEAALENLSIGPDTNDDADSGVGVKRAPRRAGRRIKAPLDLYYVGWDKHFHRVDLTAIMRDISSHLLDCVLYDVSDQGIGFVCDQRLEPGTQLTICAHHDGDTAPMVATGISVLNVRPLPDDQPRPARHGDQPLWIHGCTLQSRDAHLLYKSVLDSIAYEAVSGNRKRESGDH